MDAKPSEQTVGGQRSLAYLAWAATAPSPVPLLIFADSPVDAMDEACRMLGYTVRTFIIERSSPWNAVRLERSPSLDQFADKQPMVSALMAHIATMARTSKQLTGL